MTANRRIFLNVVATYGRSLFSLVCGFFTARWVLMALGQQDFGLYGVVGGLTAFITFLNGLMSFAVGRFYAYNVGAAAKKPSVGLEECRKWFNIALLIHTVLPAILVLVGYPLGIWAVEHFLSIPTDRIQACVWVWRFVCISCFIGMANVPFQAMYTAKQEIAELTIYGFASTTANFIFFYYMVQHPAFWLTRYALWMCLVSIIPQLLIMARAVFKYRECRIRIGYLWNRDKFKELVKFAFARFWTAFTGVAATQGQAILVNKYMGATYNASMTIATAVSGHADTFAAALSGAFWPAITNAVGEGDMQKVRDLCFRTCRFGTFLIIIFAIPLMLEIDNVLVLWLKNPPPFTGIVCLVILFRAIVERMTDGYWMTIMGAGKNIMRYSWIIGWTGVLIIFIAWILFAMGLGMWSICIALILAKFFPLFVRLHFGEKLIGLSPLYWLTHVCLPACLLSLFAVLIGCLPRLLLPATFMRVVATSISTSMVIVLFGWFTVLSHGEREMIVLKLKRYTGGRK